MKKLIALLLALVMVLALAACAAKTEPAKTETTDTKTEQTTTEETKTEDPAPAEETTGEKMYIPVMAKGFQHQFWQAVAKGSEDAAKDLGVEIYFDGPASETEIDAQVNMVKTELAKNPKAMALAALSTDAVTEILEECAEKNIPVIGFDSGVPGDTTGAVKATACTNNENAAAIAADKFNENETVVEAMKNATSDNPVIIGCPSSARPRPTRWKKTLPTSRRRSRASAASAASSSASSRRSSASTRRRGARASSPRRASRCCRRRTSCRTIRCSCSSRARAISRRSRRSRCA